MNEAGNRPTRAELLQEILVELADLSPEQVEKVNAYIDSIHTRLRQI